MARAECADEAAEIEAACSHFEGVQAGQVEAALPMMLRDMKITAGDASMH